MNLRSYVLGIVAALVVVLVAAEFLRRRRLRERHAVWWLVAGVLALGAAIFPRALESVAAFVGVGLPANLVFFVSVAILFLVSLQHAAELTRLEDKTRVLAERVALLEAERAEGESDPSGASP